MAGEKQLDRGVQICEIRPLARDPLFEVVNVAADFSALEAKGGNYMAVGHAPNLGATRFPSCGSCAIIPQKPLICEIGTSLPRSARGNLLRFWLQVETDRLAGAAQTLGSARCNVHPGVTVFATKASEKLL